MAMIKISQFSGMLPKVAGRLLPESAAIIAANVKLQSGTPEPMSQPGLAATLSNSETIFLARNGTAAQEWFSWNLDVDCVRVPLPTDVESRFCWVGDGSPKIAKYSVALTGGGGNYPAAFFDLGIPTPQAKPSVSVATGTGTQVTRFYAYTFFSADGEESGVSPISGLTTGNLSTGWTVSGMDVAPTNSGTGTATGNTFTNGSSAKHWLRVGDEVKFGGAPSTIRIVSSIVSPSVFTVSGAVITGETTWQRRADWNTAGMVKRVYRTTGTTGIFQLVATNIPVGDTSYVDSLADDAILGDEMVSQGWEPPPSGLKGLCVHSSGALAGFVGNILCFSEPLQPHAWVTASRLSASFDGVGVAAFGQSVVLATQGSPFIASGVEPASMSGETISGVLPCLSKRSVVSIGDSAIYSTASGLAVVGASSGMFTDQHYTRKEWGALNPSSAICAVSSGRIYVKLTSVAGATQVLVFDNGILARVDTPVVSLFSDVPSGELYISRVGGAYLWDDQTQVRMPGGWRSKEFVFPKPVNLGAAKIDFEVAVNETEEAANVAAIAAANAINAGVTSSGKCFGAINAGSINEAAVSGSDFVAVPASISNSVSMNLYGGPRLKLLASKVVTNTEAFKLPSGYKIDNFVVEILTQSSVAEVRLAETSRGLSDA